MSAGLNFSMICSAFRTSFPFLIIFFSDPFCEYELFRQSVINNTVPYKIFLNISVYYLLISFDLGIINFVFPVICRELPSKIYSILLYKDPILFTCLSILLFVFRQTPSCLQTCLQLQTACKNSFFQIPVRIQL